MKNLAQNRQKKSNASLATRKTSEGVVRIVSGLFRQTPIKVLNLEGLRPTPNRVRETFFDWIFHFAGGCNEKSVCDMFSGSGALSLEAASRGAKRVLAIEKNRKAAQSIKEVVSRLNAADRVEVLCADAFTVLEKREEKFDIIFVDPPFARHLQLKALEAAKVHLKETGLLFLESDAEITEESFEAARFALLRQSKAGNEWFFVLKPLFP